jgi:hypothetical protein
MRMKMTPARSGNALAKAWSEASRVAAVGHFPRLFSEQTLIAAGATTHEAENAHGAQRECLAKAWSKASRVAAVGHFPRLFFRANPLDSRNIFTKYFTELQLEVS